MYNQNNAGFAGKETLEEIQLPGKKLKLSVYTSGKISTYRVEEKFEGKQYAILFVGSDAVRANKYFQDIKENRTPTRLA
jgi:hypothetical protein